MLPDILPEQREAAARLAARIAEEIRASGPLPFSRVMQRALYEPGLGYYSAGAAKFGAAGDFITAPELGPLFARCVAHAVAPALAGGGDLVELGAGTGAFAAAVLPELARIGAVPARYRIVEVSADLRRRQHERLAALEPALAERIAWLDAPPTEPWTGVLFANEVVDALPVDRFVLGADGIAERRVALDATGALVEHDVPAAPAFAAAVTRRLGPRLSALPRPYVSEFVPQLPAWLATVGGALARGLALFVDYGHSRAEYYAPERPRGTLRAFFRHRVHEDLLARLGAQDLTASVDFTALAEAGEAAGLARLAYLGQARFLFAAGLADRMAEVAAADPDPLAQYRLAQEVKRLTLPGEMGERFRVLALGRGVEPAAFGFAAFDESFRL